MESILSLNVGPQILPLHASTLQTPDILVGMEEKKSAK
jgi:hypothetical protein